MFRDYAGSGLGQWEKALHNNTSSHWLIPDPEWSLMFYLHPFLTVINIEVNQTWWVYTETIKNIPDHTHYYIEIWEKSYIQIKYYWLTYWGRATHICISKLTIIASDNGLSPGRRQAIIWNNVGILSIGLIGTNCSEILIKILTFSFKKMHLKVLSAKWRPFCLGLNVLTL